MTAAELKASILDLAIRGKLVAQDPNDEPASELLARIAAEKAKLIKEKKIKKEKPLDPIADDEIPFELPDGWVWCRLGEIGSSNIGLTYSPQDVADKGTAVLRSNNIKNGSICLDGLVYVNGNVDIPERSIVRSKDILICARNGSRALVGKAAIIKEGGMAFGAFMTIFRTECYKYVYYFLCSGLFRSRLEGTNTTTINQITQEMLKSQMIPLPPLAEQNRIVAKVEELMPLVDRYEKAEAKRIELEKTLPGDLEKSILQEAIQGKLVEQDPNDEPASELLARIAEEKAKLIKEKKIKKEKPLAPIDESEKPYIAPDGWVWCRVEDLGLFCGGHTPSMADRTLWGNEYLWISSKDMKFKYIVDTGDKLSKKGVLELHLLPVGTMVFTTRSGILKHTFPVAILKKQATINQDQRALSLYLPEMVEYLYVVMKGLESYIIHKVTKRGTTVQSIVWDDFLKMPIALPPLAEQKRIVAKVDELLGALKRLH